MESLSCISSWGAISISATFSSLRSLWFLAPSPLRPSPLHPLTPSPPHSLTPSPPHPLTPHPLAPSPLTPTPYSHTPLPPHPHLPLPHSPSPPSLLTFHSSPSFPSPVSFLTPISVPHPSLASLPPLHSNPPMIIQMKTQMCATGVWDNWGWRSVDFRGIVGAGNPSWDFYGRKMGMAM